MEKTEQLLERAVESQKKAYAPYSKYHVGAAILSENDNVYSSCNVENASYPCGICAEAGVISAMISGGDKQIKAILITSDGNELVYPCGACLQRIAEFSNENTKIYLAKSNEIIKEHKITELLPYNFTL